MPPPRTRLDPDGYYDRLGLEPAATHAEIVAAFRGKARVLHPDVPKTGKASAFVAVKQAYDVLSNRERRAAYDRMAREAALDAIEPAVIPPAVSPEVIMVRRPSASTDLGPGRHPRFSDLPAMLWLGLGAFLCLCVYEAVTRLLTPPQIVRDDIKPNAATVLPLSPAAHQAVLYGAAPVHLAGTPNFYVVPATGPAMLWGLDPERSELVPLGYLPPFSVVEAVRLIRQNDMLEVLVNDHANGFIKADRLTPGNAAAARQAYCSYNAGPTPQDGELLERDGSGRATLDIENRAVEPAVVKLRDQAGAVVLAVFLQPGSHAALDGLPQGTYRTEFAIGELWSRACSSFAAGMRAMQMIGALELSGSSHLVVAAEEPAAADIPEQQFERH
jgi:DnaJ domain